MKNLISKNENYCIYSVGKEYLYDIVKFVVDENYKHHSKFETVNNINEEIKTIYEEELSFAETSQIYIAEDSFQRMIGCIRVYKWDKKVLLPIHKIFNINPLNYIKETKNSSFWHIGRFAVSSNVEISTIRLFKKLMMYAIFPIYQEKEGYMIAEIDSKLLQIINRLGMDTVCLKSGECYLGSETIPVYADKEGLSKFYHSYISEILLDNINQCYIKAA